jgi:hypothetical protein
MFSAYFCCQDLQHLSALGHCLIYPLFTFEIFNFPKEGNDWGLRCSQRHSFSIIRLFVALPDFPYLGYKSASSQGTK